MLKTIIFEFFSLFFFNIQIIVKWDFVSKMKWLSETFNHFPITFFEAIGYILNFKFFGSLYEYSLNCWLFGNVYSGKQMVHSVIIEPQKGNAGEEAHKRQKITTSFQLNVTPIQSALYFF